MASAGGYIQAALEQAPNAEGGANAVSSNVFYLPFTQIDFDPKPTMLERKDELRGEPAPLPHSGVAKYEPEGSMEGRLYPAVLGLMLYAAVGSCTTTAGNGVITDPDGGVIPTGAYRHVFAWKTGEIPQTLQLIYASLDGKFKKAQGVGIDELAFKVAEGAWTNAAKCLPLVDALISDPTLTPSYETAGPWREGELALSWLSGSAITKEFDWAIKLGLKTERQFTTASRYPDSIVYDANLPVVSGSIPKRSFDSDDWNALINGTTFAAKLKKVHSEHIGATSYHHSLWVEMPAAQYISGKQEAVKNERRTEASFDWEARYDTATSKWCTITLVNGTATYATYA